MDSTVFATMAATCAPLVHQQTAAAIVATESSFNPYAIGVVGGELEHQPRNLREAVATGRRLLADGWNFSVGLAQINVGNFESFGLDLASAFEPCRNLGAMQRLLVGCYERAGLRDPAPQASLRKALSCYYSGNFSTGFAHGYVRRVARALSTTRHRAAVSSNPPSNPGKELQ